MATSVEGANVKISESNISTGGFICDKGWCFDIPAQSGNHEFSISLPFDIDAMSAKFMLTGAEKKDNVTVIVAQDTIVGAVNEPSGYSAGDKIITVDSSVLSYVRAGRCVRFGSDTEFYWVTAKDTINNTITIHPKDGSDTGLVNPVSDNDYVKMSVFLADKSYVPFEKPITIGEDKLGGSAMTANTVVKVIFYNTSATQKCLHMNVEYLYGDI